MGYFPNGTAGGMYEEEYCMNCIHGTGDDPCAVMLAHNLYNYDECDKPESILHLLIPLRKDDLGNEQCRMFVARKDGEPVGPPKSDAKYREWLRVKLDKGT